MKVKQIRGISKAQAKKENYPGHPNWIEEIIDIPLPLKELSELTEKAWCLGVKGMTLEFMKDKTLPKVISTDVMDIKIKQI